jgi:hypothetical protein
MFRTKLNLADTSSFQDFPHRLKIYAVHVRLGQTLERFLKKSKNDEKNKANNISIVCDGKY